jgi:hypothetical protein
VDTTYKVLGQTAPGATTETALYTCPTNATAIISSIIICNRAGASSFRLSVSIAGAATATKDYIAYDVAIAATDTVVAAIGIALGPADTIRVYGGSANISFSAFGVELMLE